MYPIALNQLSPRDLAVIEYFYSLSDPPEGPVDLPERARRGLSHFLMYLVEDVAHEPGMLSILPGRSLDDALSMYPSRFMLVRHMVEVLAQKVLLDEEHTPETHRYTTPLAWPPNPDGGDPAHLPRFTLYMVFVRLFFGGIEGVSKPLAPTCWLAHVELEKAIRKHYARRRKRGRERP